MVVSFIMYQICLLYAWADTAAHGDWLFIDEWPNTTVVSSVLFVCVCLDVVALHYRQQSIFATFHQLLTNIIVVSAMPKAELPSSGC